MMLDFNPRPSVRGDQKANKVIYFTLPISIHAPP